jgi:transposase
MESSFLAHTLSEKFEYGLPFYRVEDRLSTQGLYITRTTLCEYQNKVSKLLEPLADELLKSVKESDFAHIDESSWRVARVENGKKRYRSAWAWAFVGGNNDVFLKYGVSRNKTSVSDLFGEYKGVIVCDGEDHYDFYQQASSDIKLSRCNAHARRKFEQAISNDEKAANLGKRIYQIIYRRERYLTSRGSKLSHDDVVRWRRRTKMLLNYLYKFSRSYSCAPKSPIGRACSYFCKYYDHLVAFCDDGRLPIDNNPAERLIRIFVIGRKAWLFSSSEEGARSSALIYSLVLTCKLNQIPVIDYLTDIIERIGVKGETDYRALLPRAWYSAKLNAENTALSPPDSG